MIMMMMTMTIIIYKGKVKNEGARKLNKQFHLDAGRVYSNFKKIIEKQEGCENPTYDAGIRDDGNSGANGLA